MELLSPTLETIGTILIAFAALRVHHRFLNEHRVDDKVFRAMRRERVVGIIGVIFVLSGYTMNVMTLI